MLTALTATAALILTAPIPTLTALTRMKSAIECDLIALPKGVEMTHSTATFGSQLKRKRLKLLLEREELQLQQL